MSNEELFIHWKMLCSWSAKRFYVILIFVSIAFLNRGIIMKILVLSKHGNSNISKMIYSILKTAGCRTVLVYSGDPVVPEVESDNTDLIAVIDLSEKDAGRFESTGHIILAESNMPALERISKSQRVCDFLICYKRGESDYTDLNGVKSQKYIVDADSLQRDRFFTDLAYFLKFRSSDFKKESAFLAYTAVSCLGVDNETITCGLRNFEHIH